MGRSSRLCTLVVAAMVSNACTDAASEEAKLIPLDQIWGYHLPGTRDVAGIPFPESREGIGLTFAHLDREREYNIEQIRRALASKAPDEKALDGFVVPGRPNSLTLRAVYSLLNRKTKPFQIDSVPGGEVTLVFFSHPLSYYTRLKNVARNGNEITVHYQFEPHKRPESTVHFALIPLENLPPGKYRVSYEQLPMDERHRKEGFEPVALTDRQTICRDFSFTIQEPQHVVPKPESASGSTVVPVNQIWALDIPGTRNARELDAVSTGGVTRNPIITAWQQLIWDKSKDRAPVGSAFVVAGEAREALVNALAAFKDEPNRSFSDRNELSLVFYTQFLGQYVQIDRIERIGQKFVIEYRPVLHASRNSTWHFALIPIGMLPAGEYEIEIKQLPTVDPEGISDGLHRDSSDRVCRDGTFYVSKEEP